MTTKNVKISKIAIFDKGNVLKTYENTHKQFEQVFSEFKTNLLKQMKTNKGFTLVELLVVIAIIVTLASIVLVGIQSATKRAKDARVIADMSQLRSQIEIEKDASGRNGLYDFVDDI